jgi:hypothetical protein
MSLIAMQGGATGTGTVTLLAPVTNTDRTLTLPDATGTVLSTATAGVPVNGPAFSVYASATTSLAASTFTKISFNTEVFDTNNNFASGTFTPTVAGYYQLNSAIGLGSYVATATIVSIYKNGAEFYRGTVQQNTASSVTSLVSGLVFANGSTDYFEIYAFQNSATSQTSSSGITGVWFNGAMIRSAV